MFKQKIKTILPRLPPEDDKQLEIIYAAAKVDYEFNNPKGKSSESLLFRKSLIFDLLFLGFLKSIFKYLESSMVVTKDTFLHWYFFCKKTNEPVGNRLASFRMMHFIKKLKGESDLSDSEDEYECPLGQTSYDVEFLKSLQYSEFSLMKPNSRKAIQKVDVLLDKPRTLDEVLTIYEFDTQSIHSVNLILFQIHF